MNRYTMAQVLNHHGIGNARMSEDTLTDAARAAGIVHACLGCGTVVAVPTGTSEAARQRFAQAYDFSCCNNSDDIVF